MKGGRRGMRHWHLAFSLLFVFAAAGARAQMPRDALGRDIHGPSKRAISLSPALTELVFAMGLQNQLAGVSQFSDFPKEASQKPSVGPYTKPNLEKLLELHPDLVLLPIEGPEDIRKRLDQIHVSYAVVSMRHIDEIGETAQKVASWLGDEATGRKFQNHWNQRVRSLFEKKRASPIPVFIEIQRSPLMAVGKDTFIDEIVTRCGGINVIKRKGYPPVSKESLLLKNIDVVLLADTFASESEKKDSLSAWTKFPATHDAQIVILNPDITARPGPRLLQGIKFICDVLAHHRSEGGKEH